MHDNGRASIESTFSLLSLIVFLIREEAWALWVVKPQRWCSHFTEGQLRSRQADWRLSERVWFQRRKRSRCVFCAEQTKATERKKTVRGDMLIFCRDRPPAVVIQSHENIVGWNEEEWASTTQNNQITGVVLVSTQPHKLPECILRTSSHPPWKKSHPNSFSIWNTSQHRGGGDSREFYCYCYWWLQMQRLQCGFSRTAQHILIKRKTGKPTLKVVCRVWPALARFFSWMLWRSAALLEGSDTSRQVFFIVRENAFSRHSIHSLGEKIIVKQS